jgi:hypothetical protein
LSRRSLGRDGFQLYNSYIFALRRLVLR